VEKARDRGKTTFCVVVFVSAECWSVFLDAIAPAPQKATKGMEGNNKKRKRQRKMNINHQPLEFQAHLCP